MKLVLATNNEDKVKEIKAILGSKFEKIYTLKELNISHETVEDGKDFYENSYKKAHEICEIAKMPTLADDTGLCIDALDGAAGLYSARFAGLDHNYLKNNEKVIELLKGVKDRSCHFITVATICFPDGKKLVAEGKAFGHIIEEFKEQKGFGYDPIFYVPEFGMTTAQMDPEQKNQISHRGKALRAMVEKLS